MNTQNPDYLEFHEPAKIYSSQETCNFLQNITRRTLNRYMRERNLKHIKVGGKIAFTGKQINDFLNGLQEQSNSKGAA